MTEPIPDAAGAPRSFESLDAALSAWGKYDEFPYKRKVALEAFHGLAEVKGLPEDPDSYGRKPFYIVEGGQYVAARWGNLIWLSFQAGFIASRVQLGPMWVPSTEDVANAGDWWRYLFPDHVRFGKHSESDAAKQAQCTCSYGIGILQPVGSRCTYCDESIAAAPFTPALPSTQATVDTDTLWQRLQDHEGQQFIQIRVGEFTYHLTDRGLVPDRTAWVIPRHHFEEALTLVPFADTTPLQHLYGPSYIYAILMDRRIRRDDW